MFSIFFAQFCFILIGLNGLAADADPKLDELKIEEIKTNKSEEIKVLGIIAKNNVGNENGTLAAENELEIDETKGNNRTESKIHHGLPIKNIAEFPFMVSLWVGGKRLCTASLISPSHILSAAHCFGLEGNYSILAGTVDAIQNNTKSIGKNIVKAHIYSEDLLGKDLAIGVLEEPLKISAEIHPVKLTKRANLVNSSAYIAGWGRVDDGSAPITLQGAKVTIWPNEEEKCDGVLATELCAFGSGGENTCFGDSGGPLLYKNAQSNEWEQIGITSRGSWLCEYKGFFTTIRLYCDWIKKITEGKAQCE